MTKLLTEALIAAEGLPAEVQDELAAAIIKFASMAKGRPRADSESFQEMRDDARAFGRTLRFMTEYAETFKALAK